MSRVLIYGKGATARVLATNWGACEVVCFDDADVVELGGWSNLRLRWSPDDYTYAIGIGYQHEGMNARRAAIFGTMAHQGYRPAFSGLEQQDIIIGAGTHWGGWCALGPGSHVGVNCMINAGAMLGHDVKIGDHTWVNSSVVFDGGAVVGARCVIGSGAVIGAGVRLGPRTLVGPGAVVLRDTPPDGVVLAATCELQRFTSDVYGSLVK